MNSISKHSNDSKQSPFTSMNNSSMGTQNSPRMSGAQVLIFECSNVVAMALVEKLYHRKIFVRVALPKDMQSRFLPKLKGLQAPKDSMEIVPFDIKDISSCKRLFESISTVFLTTHGSAKAIQTRFPVLARALKKFGKHTKHLVFTIPGNVFCKRMTNRLSVACQKAQEKIEQLAMPTTILHTSSVFEECLIRLGRSSPESMTLYGVRGSRVLWISVADLVCATCNIMQSPSEHVNRIYEMIHETDPGGLTWPVLACWISQSIGTEITATFCKLDDVAAKYKQHNGFTTDYAKELLAQLEEIGGLSPLVSEDLEKVLGRRPVTLYKWMQENAHHFLPVRSDCPNFKRQFSINSVSLDSTSVPDVSTSEC